MHPPSCKWRLKLLITYCRGLNHLGSGEYAVAIIYNYALLQESTEVTSYENSIDQFNENGKLIFLQEVIIIMFQYDHQNVIKLHGVVTEAPIMHWGTFLVEI